MGLLIQVTMDVQSDPVVRVGSGTMNKQTPKGKSSTPKVGRKPNQPLGGSAIVAAPVAYAEKQSFPLRQQRSRRIQNSEFVAVITGNTIFDATQKFTINPGLSSSFPWLSVMAAQWQQYRFHKLHYRFITRSATSSAGSIILSPDYNPRENPPTTETMASNTQDSVEDVVWKSLICKLDPESMFPLGPRKQIRTTQVAGETSIYDAGRLFCCVTGEASTAEIGRLWVDYDVEFFVPQSSPSFALGPIATSYYTRVANQAFVTGVTQAQHWDAAIYDPLGIGNDASGVFTPPAGTYRLTGQICINDTVNEVCSATLVIVKNATNQATASITVVAGSASGTYSILPIHGIVTCNGTDTVRINVNIAGIAGTLSTQGGYNGLLWSLA